MTSARGFKQILFVFFVALFGAKSNKPITAAFLTTAKPDMLSASMTVIPRFIAKWAGKGQSCAT